MLRRKGVLRDRTIVITGAASGIGRAWATGFQQEGASVVAADINEEGLAELSKLGKSLYTITVDVALVEQVKDMITYALEQTGRLDVLFNNAGLGYGYRVESSPDGAFERHVAVHLFGCVNGMREALPHMRRQGYGRIINTVSRNAEVDVPGTSAYAAAKAAIWSASRVAAREVSDSDILVNMLIPGPTNTAIWGRDRPELQDPGLTYPTARMLATLPTDGPTGKVFWNEREYRLFHPDNEINRRRAEVKKSSSMGS
jgi:3-hydroxybutyrate dehydrogenase